MSTQEENDARRVVEETEASVWRWLLLLWPVFEAIGSMFRRLFLALLGGVPAEDARQADASRETEAPVEQPTEPDSLSRVPVWSNSLVKDCLTRVAQGRRPLGNVLARLPDEVREWLGQVSQQDADRLRQEPARGIKLAFQRWSIGEPMTDKANAPIPANDPDRGKGDNDDCHFGMRR